MARPLVFSEKILLRLLPGTQDRIRIKAPDIDVSSFIREAIEEKLKRPVRRSSLAHE